MRRLLALFLFTLALLSCAPHPSRAAILEVAGEDIDGQFIGSVSMDTNSSHFRSGFARAAVETLSSGTVDPPSNRFVLPAFSNQTTLWVHAETIAGSNSTSAGRQVVGLYGSDGVRRLLIQATGGNGTVELATRNAGGTITVLTTCTSGVFPVNSLTKLDWFTHYASSGETTLYINGVQACDFVGDVTTDGITSLSQVDFAGQPSLSSGLFQDWSEIIVANQDTRNMNLVTLAPVSNGVTMNWGGTVSYINPVTINDLVGITSSASWQIAEFTTNGLPAGSFSVPAVCQAIRIEVGSSGPQTANYVIRPAGAGSDFTSGPFSPTTAFGNFYNCWTQNPNTSASWIGNDLGTGFNAGVESQP